jgi:FKBP-type peptidyl-prolyl cis-trans isomerase
MKALRTLSLITIILFGGLLAGCGNGIDSALERDGLYVVDLVEGDGEAAAVGDHLTISYVLSRYEDGGPGEALITVGDEGYGFVLGDGKVMPGWEEALVGMREGGTRRVVVGPATIGHDFRPRAVADDEALWCEITLRDVARVGITDLEPGDGPLVASGDYVEIRYRGWHWEDGARTDQFTTSGEDTAAVGIMLGAGMVNRGLELGLEGMRVGGTREVMVPPALAYGERGQDAVKPGATLVYEVELMARREAGMEILREGEGEGVGPDRPIRIHLAGWIRLPDGSKGELFNDTRNQRQPLTVVLGMYKLQPGLELGIPGMKPGELRRLHVPSAMAFGAKGWHRGDRTLVPPDTDVIYEVELLGASGGSR